jgi:hypothetical protein
MFGLSKDELKILKKLSTPHKIQDFLDTIPQNHEEAGDTSGIKKRTVSKVHSLLPQHSGFTERLPSSLT